MPQYHVGEKTSKSKLGFARTPVPSTADRLDVVIRRGAQNTLSGVNECYGDFALFETIA